MRNKDTGDHYVAGRRIGGLANGLALAGDQISAASFLGITGAIALTGFNGFYLAVGLPIAYVLVLLLVAEPLRNLGRYTLADVVAVALRGPRPARLDRARDGDHDRHLHDGPVHRRGPDRRRAARRELHRRRARSSAC